VTVSFSTKAKVHEGARGVEYRPGELRRAVVHVDVRPKYIRGNGSLNGRYATTQLIVDGVAFVVDDPKKISLESSASMHILDLVLV